MNNVPIQVSVGPINEHIKETLTNLTQTNDDIHLTVSNGNDELLHTLDTEMPDVVLITSPRGNENHALMTRIKDTTPRTRIVAITEQNEPEQIIHALQNGATGYLPESSSDEDILAAIRTAMRHGVFLYNKQVATRILEEFRRYSQKLHHLSSWERIILDRITRGHGHQEFNDEFGIERNTLEKHLGSIATKMYELNRYNAHPDTWSVRLRRLIGLDGAWAYKLYDMQVAFFMRTRVKGQRFLSGVYARLSLRQHVPAENGAFH